MTTPNDAIQLTRDCEAIQVPSGVTTILTKGTSGQVSQQPGGNFKLVLDDQRIFSVAAKDADALGCQKTEPPQPAAPAPAAPAGPLTETDIWNVLKEVYDPEMPLSIVDLGLVYNVAVKPLPDGGHRVEVKMTLTFPGCGMARYIVADVQNRLQTTPGVKEADVQLVWDPPWDRSMVTLEGKKKIGLE
ncbi:MAG: iron-sulfur cluster assembly protein [Verrucomicrobiae bacterium]|nr:iron-sulfur cluster assembly protein [Verrucomicrobiae bacterium]